MAWILSPFMHYYTNLFANSKQIIWEKQKLNQLSYKKA
jgi:hypothetical protein